MLILWVALSTPGAAREKLALRHESMALPGAPTVVLPTDLDRDGLQDLVVAVAYTEWDQIGIDEWTEMRGVDGLVMVMTVVPVVMDRREVRIYLGRRDGGYEDYVPALPIDLSVLSLVHGPPETPVILVTDEGLAALRLEGVGAGGRLAIESLIANPPVLARSGTLIPHLGLSHDVDSDGLLDLLFPVNRGLDVYLASQLLDSGEATDRVTLPAVKNMVKT